MAKVTLTAEKEKTSMMFDVFVTISFQSCQRSPSECEESSILSTGSHYTREEDPVIEALEPVVLLSGNPECHSSLLAYLCLPRAASQLTSLAHMDSVSAVINNHIAVLIGNLFNVSILKQETISKGLPA